MIDNERDRVLRRDQRRIASMGHEAYLVWAREGKRLERMRRARRAGRAYTVVEESGPNEARHVEGCLCYDCLFGWVREVREEAAANDVRDLEVPMAARTGRGSRGSKMPGVAHVGT